MQFRRNHQQQINPSGSQNGGVPAAAMMSRWIVHSMRDANPTREAPFPLEARSARVFFRIAHGMHDPPRLYYDDITGSGIKGSLDSTRNDA